MAKVMQHNMIKLKKGTLHPIFSFAYLPENIASLVETAVFLIELLFFIIFGTNLALLAFPTYAPDHIITEILSYIATSFFSSINVENNVVNGIVMLLVIGITYFLTHKYFEYVKYNLHIERNPSDSIKK